MDLRTLPSRILKLCFALLLVAALSACGEDEETETQGEPATVDKTEPEAQNEESVSEAKESAAEKKKESRVERLRKAKEERRAKAKSAREKRQKAIDSAAGKQSGRDKSATATVSGKKGSATTTRRGASTAPTAVAVESLNITRILPIADIKKLTGRKQLTSVGTLPGIAATATYNSHYVAGSKRAHFGVSVQVWKETMMRDINERYSRMRRDYPNVTDTNSITPKGFFSYWNDIMTLVFMDFQKKLIVAITCGSGLCTPEKLYKLATQAKVQL